MWILPFVFTFLLYLPCSLAGHLGRREEARPEGVTLDLSNPNPSIFTTTNHFLYEVNHRASVPRDGYSIMKVTDSGVAVWTGNDDRICKNVNQYSRYGYNTLVIIYTTYKYLDMTFYYEKNGSKWNEITLVGLNEKLDSMRDFSRPFHYPGPSSVGIGLDILHPDSSVDTFTRRPYEMVQTIHSVRDGRHIFSVAEFGIEIWKAPDGHSCDCVMTIKFRMDVMRLLLIYTRDKDGMRKVLYFHKSGGENGSEWVGMNEDAFYRRFHVEAIKESTIDAVTLDVKGKNDPVQFYINDSPNFPFAVYAPNVGYRIKAIKEGSIIIWNAGGEDQGCLYTSIYPKTTPTLAYLIIHSSEDLQELYYSKNGTTWTTMNREEYLRLAEAGFDGSTFDNTIILDLSNVDKETFYSKESNLNNYAIHLCIPSVGLKFKTIVDGEAVVWTAEEGEHCTYINLILQDKRPFAFYIFVDNLKGVRKVLYFFKRDDAWSKVSKSDYHAFLPVKVNGMTLPKMENQKIIMSSFRNKQGLKIISYSSTVDNSRGDIVLCHGIRSHFMSDFGTPNVEWNFERFGSHVSLCINGLFLQENSHKRNLVNLHKHIFEHASLEGKDASLVQPAYEYEGSLIEFLNKLGYNVYGIDLQSHGLSEAQTEKKCFVEKYEDYVHDLLQFISIVRRGRFYDSSEKWDEQLVYKSHPTDRKTLLWGHSMGGNIAMQAIQEFYKEVKNPNAHFVDGLIVTSGMFNIDFYLDTMAKKAAKSVLSLLTENILAKTNTYETPLNYGDTLDLFIRHKDPSFKTSRLTFKATKLAFDACDYVKKEENMVHYPKDLPTLIIHARDDDICDVKGPRELMDKHFKNNDFVKYVELDGSLHYLTIPQTMVALQKYFKEWLEQCTRLHQPLAEPTVSA